MIRNAERQRAIQSQLNDYAVALALVLELAVLYGGFKLASSLGLVHVQNKVAEASTIHL